MKFKDDVKAVMRQWPEEKKITLLQQHRIANSQHQKEITKEDLSKLFFEEAPLIVYGMLLYEFVMLLFLLTLVSSSNGCTRIT